MLAENTVIDARTRWREASALLQDDARFKNVEDMRDREDLFNDFVSELEKKEKEDRVRLKSDALKCLDVILVSRKGNGTITRRSTWTEERDGLLKSPDLLALDDAEVKRIFQDFVGKLDFAHKEEERQRKVEVQRRFEVCSVEFRALLERLSYEGEVTPSSRWSECCAKPSIANSACYRELEALSNAERKEGVTSGGCARDTFEKLLVAVRESYRADKRLVQDVLRDWEQEVRHNTTLQEFLDAVYTAAGVKTTPQLNASAPVICSIAALTEDGEEVEEEDIQHVQDNSTVGFGKLLRCVLAKRPFALENIFADLLEEEKRRQAKRELNLLRLLDEYYFENPNDTWEECKRAVGRHPAYLDMMKIDRDKVYQTFSASRLMSKVKRKEERSRSRDRDGDRNLDRDSKMREKVAEGDSVRSQDGSYGSTRSAATMDHQKDPGSIDSTTTSNHNHNHNTPLLSASVGESVQDVTDTGSGEGRTEDGSGGEDLRRIDTATSTVTGKRNSESGQHILDTIGEESTDNNGTKKRKIDQSPQI